jgi:hypothetical protein
MPHGMDVDRQTLQALMDAPLNRPGKLNERRRVRSTTVPRGHAAPIGTGPAGESCGECKHLFRNELSRTYLKCELMRAIWTGGGATDVRAGDAACRRWERKAP